MYGVFEHIETGNHEGMRIEGGKPMERYLARRFSVKHAEDGKCLTNTDTVTVENAEQTNR